MTGLILALACFAAVGVARWYLQRRFDQIDREYRLRLAEIQREYPLALQPGETWPTYQVAPPLHRETLAGVDVTGWPGVDR